MASQKKRMSTLQDEAALKAMVKLRLKENPGKSQLLWMYPSLEDVAENYEAFLTDVADTGCRLSKKMLVRVLKGHFEGDGRALEEFATRMVATLSHCRRKVAGISSGSRTKKAVLSIATAIGKAGSAVVEAPPSSSLGVQLPTEVATSSSSDVEMVESCLGDGGAAAAALEDAKRLFGQGSGKTLGKHDSIVSIQSSEPSSPQAAGGDAPGPQEVDMGWVVIHPVVGSDMHGGSRCLVN